MLGSSFFDTRILKCIIRSDWLLSFKNAAQEHVLQYWKWKKAIFEVSTVISRNKSPTAEVHFLWI